MDKYNRPIEQDYLEQSKQRVVGNVMDEIQKEGLFSRLLAYKKPLVASLVAAALVFLAVLSSNPLSGDQTPPTTVQPITLKENDIIKFAEVSYLSGTLVASSFQVDNTGFVQMNTADETAFEGKFDEYHQYFHMLKVFLEPDYFKNTAQLVESDDEMYASKLMFEADGVQYVLYMNVEEEQINGVLYVGQKTFDLVGSYEESDDEFSLDLYASKENNYIDISYDSEIGTESESTYSIESMINGVYQEKEISVSHEADEYKVEMENSNSSFELEYEISDEGNIYYLSYEIEDQEGEVLITETVNEFGEVVYHYEVTEGDISREIDRGKPSLDDDDEEEDEEDEVDEEDEIDEEDDEVDTIHEEKQTIQKKYL